MSDYDFVAGDIGELQIPCFKQGTNTPLSLGSGESIKVAWRDENGVVVNKNATIDDPNSVVAKVQFDANELYAPLMSIEVLLVDATSRVTHANSTINLKIRDPIDS